MPSRRDFLKRALAAGAGVVDEVMPWDLDPPITFGGVPIQWLPTLDKEPWPPDPYHMLNFGPLPDPNPFPVNPLAHMKQLNELMAKLHAKMED